MPHPLPTPLGAQCLVEAGGADGLVVAMLGRPDEEGELREEHKVDVEEEIDDDVDIDSDDNEHENIRLEWLDETAMKNCPHLSGILMLQDAIEQELIKRGKHPDITLSILQTGVGVLSAAVEALEAVLKTDGTLNELRLEENKDNNTFSVYWDGEEIIVFNKSVL